MDDGAKLGIIKRNGEFRPKNGLTMRNDFYLATALILSQIHLHRILCTRLWVKEWVWNNGLIKEADVADIKETIEENHRTNNAAADALAFAKFLQKL